VFYEAEQEEGMSEALRIREIEKSHLAWWLYESLSGC